MLKPQEFDPSCIIRQHDDGFAIAARQLTQSSFRFVMIDSLEFWRQKEVTFGKTAWTSRWAQQEFRRPSLFGGRVGRCGIDMEPTVPEEYDRSSSKYTGKIGKVTITLK